MLRIWPIRLIIKICIFTIHAHHIRYKNAANLKKLNCFMICDLWNKILYLTRHLQLWYELRQSHSTSVTFAVYRIFTIIGNSLLQSGEFLLKIFDWKFRETKLPKRIIICTASSSSRYLNSRNFFRQIMQASNSNSHLLKTLGFFFWRKSSFTII